MPNKYHHGRALADVSGRLSRDNISTDPHRSARDVFCSSPFGSSYQTSALYFGDSGHGFNWAHPVPPSRCVFYSRWAMPKSDCASIILGRAPPFRTKDAPTLPPCVPPSLSLRPSVLPPRGAVTPGQVSPCVPRHVY